MSKTKLYIIFILILIGSSVNANWIKNHREFWNAYIGVIKGNEFLFNADCLGGKFLGLYDNLEKAMLSRDLSTVVFSLMQIFDLQSKVCPLEELNTIFKDFRSSTGNGSAIKNVLKIHL